MHGRGAGNHCQLLRRQARQRGDDFIGHGIAEVLLRRIAAQILEWKHRQPGPAYRPCFRWRRQWRHIADKPIPPLRQRLDKARMLG